MVVREACYYIKIIGKVRLRHTAYNTVYLANASAQIGSLRSPTSDTPIPLAEIPPRSLENKVRNNEYR